MAAAYCVYFLSVLYFRLFLVNLEVLHQVYITFFSVSPNTGTLPRLQKQLKN